jgi:MFS family permease
MPRLPALRSRNYRLFFAGQLISLLGTWMQQIAMVWLAYRLSNSTVILGLVGFASQLPILLFSTLAGVWNDRLDRRRLLIGTQSLAMLQALLLYGLAAGGLATPLLLIALAFILGCINAVDLPARQAFVAELVSDREHLANAIGLNSLLMNLTRFAGPTLAGIIVAATDETVCFLLNAVSYLGVIVALRAIRVAPRPAQHEAAWTALRAGLAYAASHPEIRRWLLMVAGFSFCVTPYTILMPAFARDVYGGGADTYGFLVGSAGLGSLLAALFLALRGGKRKTAGLDRLVARAMLLGGAALAVFTLVTAPLAAYPLLAGLGFAVVLTAAGSNTLIQTRVDEAYRGRVMAIFSTAFLGVAPLGSLAIGSVSAAFGARPTLFGCGLLALLLGALNIRRVKPATEKTKGTA